MRAVLLSLQATLSKEGIEETNPTAAPATGVEQPAVAVDSLDGAADATQLEADAQIEAARSDTTTADIGSAIEAATELDSLQVALEGICESRLPTVQELALIRRSATLALQHAGLEFVSNAQESSSLDANLELTKEDLHSTSAAVWDAIKKALAKLAAGLSKAWHTFVFWLKSRTSQVKQFLGELEKFEGTPKFDHLKLGAKWATYTGLGDERSPVGVIKALETTNKYVYSELWYQLSQFASQGTPVPKVNDDLFVDLPASPRFRAGADSFHFLEQPATPKLLNVMVPSVEDMKEWCQAFLDESLYFIQNYESFKSTAEKIYDVVRDQVDDEENQTAADLMDAGSKALFARSHSCVEAMESWVWYAWRVMTAHHGTLMALRKAFI